MLGRNEVFNFGSGWDANLFGHGLGVSLREVMVRDWGVNLKEPVESHFGIVDPRQTSGRSENHIF